MFHRLRFPETHRHCLTILVALLCLLPSGASAQAATRLPTVAVMPLQAKGVSVTDADLISDAIANRLQQKGTMRVLERAQMDKILKEQGFQQSGACDGAECAVEVGKLLSMDRMLVGCVGLLGHTYTLSLRMVSVGTGEVVRASMGDHAGTIDQLLTKLVPQTVNDLTDPRSPSDPSVSSGGSHWGWWLGGGAVVAGGAAAILLMKGSSSTGSPGPTQNTTSLSASW
jgi:hypothetical protein